MDLRLYLRDSIELITREILRLQKSIVSLAEANMDVVMPGLRGAELAKQVAEFRPGVHVIFISGYAQSLPEAQIPAGAAFLQKPFRFASLAEQLKLMTRKA